MLKRYYSLPPLRRFLLFSRPYSDDPAKTFKDKGLCEENRYFLREQERQILKLHRKIQRLEGNQKQLQDQLDEANKKLTDLSQSKACENCDEK